MRTSSCFVFVDWLSDSSNINTYWPALLMVLMSSCLKCGANPICMMYPVLSLPQVNDFAISESGNMALKTSAKFSFEFSEWCSARTLQICTSPFCSCVHQPSLKTFRCVRNTNCDRQSVRCAFELPPACPLWCSQRQFTNAPQ